MQEKKLGIMAIQETHLTEEDVNTIHQIYGRRLRVFNSEGERATTAEGDGTLLGMATDVQRHGTQRFQSEGGMPVAQEDPTSQCYGAADKQYHKEDQQSHVEGDVQGDGGQG